MLARILQQARLVVLVPVLGLTVAAVATYGWGVERTIDFVDVLIEDPDGGKAVLVKLLRLVDVYLLGTVLLVMALGLYELFVGQLDLPDWLEIHDLDGLKGKLIDVVVILLGLSVLEALADSGAASDDTLRKAITAAVGIVALTAFRVAKAPRKPEAPG